MAADRRTAPDVGALLDKALGSAAADLQHALVAASGVPESGDFGLLQRSASSSDADLRWIARDVSEQRVERWPEPLAAVRQRGAD